MCILNKFDSSVMHQMKCLVFIFFICCIPLLGCGRDGLSEVYKQDPFNHDKWIKQSFLISDKPTPRQRMLNDLIKNVLPGKSKIEIIELLGHPDSEELKFVDYRIGPEITEYSISIDFEYFEIFFDDKDRFVKYNLTHS